MLSIKRGNLTPLLEHVVKSLSIEIADRDSNYAILKTVCQYLLLDGAFIYMRNYSKGIALYLQTEVKLSPDVYFPEEIDRNIVNMERLICSEDVTTRESLESDLTVFLSLSMPELKNSSDRVVALPITEGERTIGIVGVLSLSNEITNVVDNERAALMMILALVMGNIKTSYFRDQRLYVRESLERAIDNTGVDIYVTDFFSHEILYVNKSMAAPYGGSECMLGKKCYLTLYDDKRGECDYCPKWKLLDEKGNPSKLYSWDYQRPFDGAWFRVFSAAFKWEEDRLALVVTSMNITENKNNEFLIEKMALYDALTNIPNRRSFERDFEKVIERSLINGTSGYVLFVDLDNFKYINDAFGHEKGDELLIKVARYLDGFSNKSQQAYRYGGDEFFVLVEEIELNSVTEFIEILISRFAKPWILGDLEYFCTASIGVAAFPRDGTTYDVLLNTADMAMYEAKKNGKASAYFSTGEGNRRSEYMEIEFALRRAILDGCNEFELRFHPIVDARDGRWAGAEALMRWNSPQFGVVYPDEFIPICEKLGLMFELEKWSLAASLKEVTSWELKRAEDFFISLNVSPLEFNDDSFSNYILNVLDEYRYPHSNLMLELIETKPKFNLEVKKIRNRLSALRDRNILIALDGFGIGNDSLTRIQEISVDFIKVDRKFISDFLGDDLKTAVVKAIIMLARAAHAKVCAEGVESEAHLRQLIEIGCDFVQGVYFSKPVTGKEFKALLLQHQ